MRSFISFSTAAVLALSAATTAFAGEAPPPGTAVLNGWATADNLFNASISTSATDVGTPWFSGTNWQSMYSGSLNITQPGTYYIQVRAQDQGRPEMFIGRFTLTGVDGTFANGTHELVTNTTDWVVSNTGFGQSTTSPLFLADNGGGAWGTAALVGANADYIWAPAYIDGIAYFTASFTVTPAPGAAAVLGLGGLLAARRRRA